MGESKPLPSACTLKNKWDYVFLNRYTDDKAEISLRGQIIFSPLYIVQNPQKFGMKTILMQLVWIAIHCIRYTFIGYN